MGLTSAVRLAPGAQVPVGDWRDGAVPLARDRVRPVQGQTRLAGGRALRPVPLPVAAVEDEILVVEVWSITVEGYRKMKESDKSVSVNRGRKCFI